MNLDRVGCPSDVLILHATSDVAAGGDGMGLGNSVADQGLIHRNVLGNYKKKSMGITTIGFTEGGDSRSMMPLGTSSMRASKRSIGLASTVTTFLSVLMPITPDWRSATAREGVAP